MPEDREKKCKRLIFRSWHRGTREMDLMLGSFVEAHILNFSDSDLTQYDDILGHSDPDLYNWITRKAPVPAQYDSDVMKKLIAHHS